MDINESWSLIGDSYYIKYHFYNMKWKIAPTNFKDYIFAHETYGGSIAAISKSPSNQELMVFTPSGILLSSLMWKDAPVIGIHWSENENIFLLHKSGRVDIYSLLCQYVKYVGMGDSVKEHNVKSFRFFMSLQGSGLMVLTECNELFYKTNLLNTDSHIHLIQHARQWLPEHPIIDWLAFTDLGFKDTVAIFASGNSLIRFKHDDEPMIFGFGCSWFSATTAIVRIVLAMSEMKLAILSNDSTLWIVSTDLGQSLANCQFEFEWREGDNSQMEWAGEDLVVIYHQEYLFLLDIDSQFSSCMYLNDSLIFPEIDGARIISAARHEFLQKVPPWLEQLFRITTESPAMLLLYAQQHLINKNADAVNCLELIMSKSGQMMPDYYNVKVVGVRVDQTVLKDLVQSHLGIHLAAEKFILDSCVSVTNPVSEIIEMVSISWFLTIYLNVLSFQNAINIMDYSFYDGAQVIFQIALEILKCHSDTIEKVKRSSLGPHNLIVLANVYIVEAMNLTIHSRETRSTCVRASLRMKDEIVETKRFVIPRIEDPVSTLVFIMDMPEDEANRDGHVYRASLKTILIAERGCLCCTHLHLLIYDQFINLKFHKFDVFEALSLPYLIVQKCEPSIVESVGAPGSGRAGDAVLVVAERVCGIGAGVLIDEQIRGHSLLAYTLVVKQMIVGIHKMYSTRPPFHEKRIDEIKEEVSSYLKKIGYATDNVTSVSNSGWNDDSTVEKDNKVLYEETHLPICVSTPNGRTEIVQMSPRSTIYRLKLKLEELTGIPVLDQRLVFAGKQLMDGWTVLECAIKHWSAVHLLLRLRGGASHDDFDEEGQWLKGKKDKTVWKRINLIFVIYISCIKIPDQW